MVSELCNVLKYPLPFSCLGIKFFPKVGIIKAFCAKFGAVGGFLRFGEREPAYLLPMA
jgi:hypothetical protein